MIFSSTEKKQSRLVIGLNAMSMTSILLLCFSSYLIEDIAQGTAIYPINTVGSFIIAQYSAMAFFMLFAWATSANSSQLRDYKSLLIVAVFARIALFDITPYTSNDVDRYLFDGRIAYEGYDPYRISHDAPQLTDLRKKWQPPAEHAAYVTLYPPVSLALFTFSSSFDVDHAKTVWKLLLLIVSMLTLAFSCLVLKKAGKLRHLPLVALSPLLILETGVGLHIDAFSALAVITAIYFWQRQQLSHCAIAMAIGMAIKILPIMILLPLVFTQDKLNKAISLILTTLILVLLIYAATYFMGYHPVGSIGVFFEKWRFASPFFYLVGDALTVSELVSLLVFIVITTVSLIAYTSFKCQFLSVKGTTNRLKNNDIIYLCLQLSLALPLLISPVVFPWYLLPLIPLLALKPNAYLIAWTLIMPLTYEVLGQFIAKQIWQPAQWPTWLLGVVYCLTLLHISIFAIKYFKKNSASNLSFDEPSH